MRIQKLFITRKLNNIFKNKFNLFFFNDFHLLSENYVFFRLLSDFKIIILIPRDYLTFRKQGNNFWVNPWVRNTNQQMKNLLIGRYVPSFQALNSLISFESL